MKLLSLPLFFGSAWLLVPLLALAEAPPKVGYCPLSSLLQSQQHQITAQVLPRQTTDIAAEIGGKIIKLHLDYSGQTLKAGALLAQLDDGDLQLQAKLLATELKGTQPQLKFARYQLKQAQKLHAQSSISEQVLRQREAELAAIEAQQQSLMVQQQQVQHNISKTLIYAPFSGVMLQKHIGLGAWVNPGQALLTLFDPEQVEIHAYLDAAQQQSLKLAQAIDLYDGTEHYPLRLYTVLPQLEPQRHLYHAILSSQSPHPPAGLQALLSWQSPDAKLPADYVIQRGESPGVMWLNSEQQAQFLPLPSALAGRNVSLTDVSPETRIIVYGQQQLEHGDSVLAEAACPQ